MVTKDEIQDGDVLTLETRLNGEVMQHATTDMVCVKFYSKGQMSGKKWEDALSSNCTLQDEHLEREVFPWILYQ
ncbi:hypothetical protein BIZ35_09035 [Heyndrickxia coagulans]|uniref:Uncharacterized protein n=2 Tax=Heyndrickxia coagulans TaxID=1398 RepID=G2TP92_HEYCO|nr:hypothetical protein Bcoa_2234 [Heyndrickxia coagulans 36D1]APB36946.1 hypothetical protein BIZ35_09035 [Heyndrickxia coagulans]